MKKLLLRTIFAIVLILLMFCLLSTAVAQVTVNSPSIVWSQTYLGVGAVANGVIQTKDGGYLLLCSDFTPPNVDSSGVFYLVKVDSSGNEMWSKTYSGAILDSESVQCVVQTADGGYAVAAEYQNMLLLLKTDQEGNKQWTETYAGAGPAGCTLIRTNDGGFAVVGNSVYGGTVWLVKTDSHGNAQWNQTFGMGEANSLIQTADGGYAVAGQTEEPNSNYMLLKVDSTGNLQWNQTYFHQDENDLCSVVQTGDGGYALGGWIWLRIGSGDSYAAITKTDAYGNALWTKYYGGGIVWEMLKTSDGGFALLEGGALIKLDYNGTEQWETGGFAGQAGCFVQTQNSGYAIAGDVSTGTIRPWLAIAETANSNQTTQPSVTQSPTLTALMSPSSTPTPTASPSSSPFPSVPEFPSWIILPLLTVTTLATFTCIKKIKK